MQASSKVTWYKVKVQKIFSKICLTWNLCVIDVPTYILLELNIKLSAMPFGIALKLALMFALCCDKHLHNYETVESNNMFNISAIVEV